MADIAKLNSLELSTLRGISSTVGDNVYSVSTILWLHGGPYVPPIPFEYISDDVELTMGMRWDDYGPGVDWYNATHLMDSTNVGSIVISQYVNAARTDYLKLESLNIGSITDWSVSTYVLFRKSAGTYWIGKVELTLCNKYMEEISSTEIVGQGGTVVSPVPYGETATWNNLSDLGEEHLNNLWIKITRPKSEYGHTNYITNMTTTVTGLATSGTEYEGVWLNRTSDEYWQPDWEPYCTYSGGFWTLPNTTWGSNVYGVMYRLHHEDYGKTPTKLRITASGFDYSLHLLAMPIYTMSLKEIWYDPTIIVPYEQAWNIVNGTNIIDINSTGNELGQMQFWRWDTGETPPSSYAYITEISLFCPFDNPLFSYEAINKSDYNMVWLEHLPDSPKNNTYYVANVWDNIDTGYYYNDISRTKSGGGAYYDFIRFGGCEMGLYDDGTTPPDRMTKQYSDCEYILNLKIGHPATGICSYVYVTLCSGTGSPTTDITSEELVYNNTIEGGPVWTQVTWSGVSFNYPALWNNVSLKAKPVKTAISDSCYIWQANIEIIPNCNRTWQNRTDIKYWDGENLTWDGTAWSLENVPGEYCYLHFKGPWFKKARPTKIRIKVATGGIGNLRIYDKRKDYVTEWQQPAGIGTYEYDIMTHGFDLGYIEMHYFNDPTTISEISFYY